MYYKQCLYIWGTLLVNSVSLEKIGPLFIGVILHA